MFIQFFSFQDDKLLQSVGAYQLSKGEGITYAEVHVSNLSREIKTPLIRWPAGYSIMVAGVFKVTGHLMISTLILDFLFIIIFFFVLYKLLKFFHFPNYLISLLLLYLGFSINEYVARPTDLHAVVFQLIALYTALAFYTNNSKSAVYGIVIGIWCFLPSFLKYLYIPSSIITGGVLLTLGLCKKDNRVIRGAVYCLTTIIVCTAILLLFNTWYAGTASYVMPAEKGFFPQNLLNIYPFIVASLININLLNTQLSLITTEPYSYWHQICILVNMAIIFGLLFLLIRFWKTVRSKMTTPWQVFSWMVAGIILMLILLTGYLSITQSPYRHTLKESHFWTFIGDGRYYTFAYVLIPFILSRVIFRRNPDQGIITKTAQYLFVSLLCFSIIHTTSFLIKRWDVEKVTEHATFPLPLKQYLAKRISHANKKSTNIVLTGHSENVANWGVLNGAMGLLNSDELIIQAPKASQNTELLLVIREREQGFYDKFFKTTSAKLDSVIGVFYVYSYLIRVDEP